VTVVEPPVLVVEDDAMVRGWVRLSLRDSEFRIVGEAEDALQARALIERRCPDVMLVDYRLPDRAGTELIRDLRQEGFAAPMVLMTANNERGLNEAVRAAGGQGTVLKTGSTEEMLRALRDVLAGGQAFDPRHPPRDLRKARSAAGSAKCFVSSRPVPRTATSPRSSAWATRR
jgi:DNA-binding NarL/FixJ family response regulator